MKLGVAWAYPIRLNQFSLTFSLIMNDCSWPMNSIHGDSNYDKTLSKPIPKDLDKSQIVWNKDQEWPTVHSTMNSHSWCLINKGTISHLYTKTSHEHLFTLHSLLVYRALVVFRVWFQFLFICALYGYQDAPYCGLKNDLLTTQRLE